MKKAFSIIELSVVVIVISIMVYGIFFALSYVDKYRLNNARSMTINSVVGKIEDLGLWLEPTLDKSFDGPKEDLDALAVWHDINSQVLSKIDYRKDGVESQPSYVKKGIAGMPSVLFDRDNYLLSDSAPIMMGKEQYTIFVVWQQDSDASGKQHLFYQEGANCNYHDGDDCDGNWVGLYVKSGSIYGSVCEDNNDYLVTNYVAGQPYITAYRVDDSQENNLSVYVNGQVFGPVKRHVNVGPVASVLGDNFKGMIAEVIIYNRALLPEEMDDVGAYLRSKYGVY